MALRRSFRFIDDDLNRKAIRLVEKAGVACTIDDHDVIHYSSLDEEKVENELIRSVRSEVFPRWIVLSFPPDWTERYRDYMVKHDIPYREELRDGRLRFLIPATYRPHKWKLE